MDISNNPNEIAIIVGLAFLIAGIVKGVIGIGLPTTAITIMTFFVSPLMALGLNLIPMTVANFWQFSKADEPKELMKSYKYLVIYLILIVLPIKVNSDEKTYQAVVSGVKVPVSWQLRLDPTGVGKITVVDVTL